MVSPTQGLSEASNTPCPQILNLKFIILASKMLIAQGLVLLKIQSDFVETEAPHSLVQVIAQQVRRLMGVLLVQPAPACN